MDSCGYSRLLVSESLGRLAFFGFFSFLSLYNCTKVPLQLLLLLQIMHKGLSETLNPVSGSQQNLWSKQIYNILEMTIFAYVVLLFIPGGLLANSLAASFDNFKVAVLACLLGVSVSVLVARLINRKRPLWKR